MKRILVDTNAYSEYYRGDIYIKREIDLSEEIFMSTVVLGELMYGFKRGIKEMENIGDLRIFVANLKVRILQLTPNAARNYAEIKYQLRKKGRLIPENDVWIAAQVMETGAMLVTYDSHFLAVGGLKVWRRCIARK